MNKIKVYTHIAPSVEELTTEINTYRAYRNNALRSEVYATRRMRKALNAGDTQGYNRFLNQAREFIKFADKTQYQIDKDIALLRKVETVA